MRPFEELHFMVYREPNFKTNFYSVNLLEQIFKKMYNNYCEPNKSKYLLKKYYIFCYVIQIIVWYRTQKLCLCAQNEVLVKWHIICRNKK